MKYKEGKKKNENKIWKAYDSNGEAEKIFLRNNTKIFQIWDLQSSGLRNSTNTKLRNHEENYAKARIKMASYIQ